MSTASDSDHLPSTPNRPAKPSLASIERWIAVMEANEQFLLAGLRRQVGPDGDLQAAYRQWYHGVRQEHDKMIEHRTRELGRRLHLE